MAKVLDAMKFIDLVQQSELVELEQIDKVQSEIESAHGGALPSDPKAVADYFVDAKLLTRWQSNNLLRGKHKGYFLGKYKLLGFLGSGGMSSVYLAEHTLMHRKQAIKVLPRNRVSNASYLERFLLEAQATARLDHPNIVRAYDVDHEGDIHYLVMEYVPGRDLQSWVSAEGPMGFRRAAQAIAQAARGLQHAHDAKLIHRDVKPANLLVDEKGVVKLLDLGLALFARDGEASLTLLHNETVLGTADYLAPEQAISSHDVDSRADIYSLGCTFYFLLTGHAVFPKGTLAQRIAEHQSQTPADIRIDRPDCPTELIDISSKMMQKNPIDRYRSMSEVADQLDVWCAKTPRDATGDTAVDMKTHLIDDNPHAPTIDEAIPAVPSETGGDSGRLNLDIEVVAGHSNSRSARSRLNGMRNRRQRLDQMMRWTQWAIGGLFLLIVLIVMFNWITSDPAPTPAPPPVRDTLDPGLRRLH